MGRLTFEAYVTTNQNELKEKLAAFEGSKSNFEEELAALRDVVPVS